MSDVTETACPNADELAEAVRGLFAGGGVAGGITHQLSNGERYTVQSVRFVEAVIAKRQAALATAQTEAADLRAEVERLRAEMARRDANENRNCINWGPCSRHDKSMADPDDYDPVSGSAPLIGGGPHD